VLFVVTFMDALVHQAYFQWTSPFLERAGLAANWIMPAMSIGQIAEIATMAVLGTVLHRLGWRTTMAIGIAAHAARFFIYAIGDPLWLMVAVNVVHGMCYAFFFAAVYIFVDEYFPRDSRASAQGLFNLLILGLGPFVGSLLWGALGDRLRTADGHVDFGRLFMAPAWLARPRWFLHGRRASGHLGTPRHDEAPYASACFAKPEALLDLLDGQTPSPRYSYSRYDADRAIAPSSTIGALPGSGYRPGPTACLSPWFFLRSLMVEIRDVRVMRPDICNPHHS
jgi:MFS family permease